MTLKKQERKRSPLAGTTSNPKPRIKATAADQDDEVAFQTTALLIDMIEPAFPTNMCGSKIGAMLKRCHFHGLSDFDGLDLERRQVIADLMLNYSGW